MRSAGCLEKQRENIDLSVFIHSLGTAYVSRQFKEKKCQINIRRF